jgi:uncharacterized oxidoreductase
MRLTDNTILVIGGTSGIGRALAEAFRAHGNHVIIAGRRQHLLDAITAAYSGMRGVQLDVEDARALDAFSNRVREQFPGLNVLINNAGISKPEDLTLDSIDVSAPRSIIDTNIIGVLHLTARLLPAQAATATGVPRPRAEIPTTRRTPRLLIASQADRVKSR